MKWKQNVKGNYMYMSVLVKFYLNVILWLILLNLDYFFDNTLVELIAITFAIIPLYIFIKMRCPNCGKKIGKFKGFNTIFITQKCYHCGHNLLKCENEKKE